MKKFIFLTILILGVLYVVFSIVLQYLNPLAGAVKTGNVILCDRLDKPDQRDDCHYLTIRQNTEKYELADCDKINELNAKSGCYFYLLRDKPKVSSCEKVTEQYYRDTCYEVIADTIQDPLLCEKIETEVIKNNCYIGTGAKKSGR
ncbi:MAG: hypothetical protein AAB677_02625 [Patescibacteria group bacterium]